jgi:hypothetical protein
MSEVFDGAAKLGLDKCSPEDGPQLRHQYLDQPMGEYLHIGMDPITDSHGFRRWFIVINSKKGLYMGTDFTTRSDIDTAAAGSSIWVFRRRKP